MKCSTMSCIALICLIFQSCNTLSDNQSTKQADPSDSLPAVLSKNHSDLIKSRLRLEAGLKFEEHQLPENLKDWEKYREKLRNEIITKAGVIINHNLPLNIKETGSIQLKGYSVKNIAFQTRPGIYATANLYIPDGKGPFPGVINMCGHWMKGKIDSSAPQAVGHSLALNKYVCLTIDPWGAGERSTIHGKYEYHGSNLGASLMNIGESLMGIQISDNIRGVDLLCSLNYVDPEKIGATGASGGGNQTMWLAALDERIKAAVPVVSVGTFESYIMESNCICELLIDGLTFTEEAGILSLSNAIKMINHKQDDNPTFFPKEMLRSFNNASPVFKIRGVENNISYQLFDLTHGYMAEDREAMLGWFDLHLKGIGTGKTKKEIPFEQLPEEKLLVFPPGQRDVDIVSTDEYCKRRGSELRAIFLNSTTFDKDQKRKELSAILRIDENINIKKVHQLAGENGWDRIALETSDGLMIPLLHLAPVNKSTGYVIMCNTAGKNNIPLALVDNLKKKGSGIVLVDLSGTGEVTSTSSLSYDDVGKLHTLSRAELWLGKTILGEWVKELSLVTKFLNSGHKGQKISIDGSREAGLAGLFLCAIEGNIDNIILRDAPISYCFDDRDSVGYYSMGIFLPGFLNWGDISLAAALSGKDVSFINPLTMSGKKLSAEKLKEYQKEYNNIRKICSQQGTTTFN
jgi:hypothetical protein